MKKPLNGVITGVVVLSRNGEVIKLKGEPCQVIKYTHGGKVAEVNVYGIRTSLPVGMFTLTTNENEKGDK